MNPTDIRNIGLLAHVDAGKTTTTEQMLFRSGSIKSAGRVDSGTTQTDYMAVERERGISVKMAATMLPWHGCQINLVDTPGHTDFVAEVERALSVLDGAVLIISAAEGVQAHTETIWHALRSRAIPTLLFVNKLDRLGADPARVLAQIRTRLTDRAVPVQAIPRTEHDLEVVEPLGEAELLERLANFDEAALERYVSDVPGAHPWAAQADVAQAGVAQADVAQAGAPDLSWARRRLTVLTHAGEAFPVLFGASLRSIGVAELLDAVVEFLPPPGAKPGARPGATADGASTAPAHAPLAGYVFKVERDPVMGRIAYVRLYSGWVKTRDEVTVGGRTATIAQLSKMRGRQKEIIPWLAAGDIGVFSGLGRVRAGDVIGDPALVPAAAHLANPFLRVQVWPVKPPEQPKLLAAVQELADEDPSMQVHWVPDTRELTVTVMGPVQVEILASLLATRYGLTARIDPPTVIYRETPVGTGEGKASLKLHGYAYVHFRIEPGAPGSGLVVKNEAPHDDLFPQFAEAGCRSAADTLTQGLHGWQVTDATVTLLDGAFDSISSVVGNYTAASPMAVMRALAEASTRLLEPTYRFHLSIPAESGGVIVGELVKLRAAFDGPVAEGDRLRLEGILPVATAMDFPARLSGMAGGRGLLTLQPGPYQPAPSGVQAERPRVGVNPLDHSLYVLSLRGVVTG